MISVVMAVYNGEKYLCEQLDSIVTQSLLPDEIIIMDDMSTDATFEILQKYSSQYLSIIWKIFRNNKNIGWRRNFIEGLKKAEGEFVFFCDQDDIWYKEKIETMFLCMKSNIKIKLLASTYTPIYENGNQYIEKKILKNFKQTNTVKQVKFTEKFLYVDLPGCVYLLHRDLVKKIIEKWYYPSAHDSIAWRIAMIDDSLYILDRPLIYFRRHNKSATAKKRNSYKEKISDCLFWKQVIDNLLYYLQSSNNSLNKQKILLKAQRFVGTRLHFYETKNPFRWFICWKYYKYYFSLKSLLGDLYYVLKERLNNENTSSNTGTCWFKRNSK